MVCPRFGVEGHREPMVGPRQVTRWIVVLALTILASACSADGSDATVSPGDQSVATSGRPVTADDLIGIWVRQGVGAPFLRFEGDGTFAGDNYRERLYADPQAHGTYEVDDGSIAITMDDDPGGCAPLDTWVWEATLVAEGRLVTVTLDDGTPPCSTSLGAERTWIRIGAE
jgi:hypothetical protein